ncbi:MULTISPECIES: DUF2817 domain-containing protein [unclassified Pantoea]|uniref:DUF2817 domain-containing protein n=1 Tax=unclassified Pantoea TaxID=2630326 RepID=UPI002477541F|nr:MULTISPECIES: DUF2817 domain-containing protein [unclassified Pantoea]GME41716.1 hypothetical protein ACJ3_28680 [Pantoea sp. QMID3]GME42284.1 hypothetical protein ACJ1_30040 [Pantoea sp. QMID1]GME57477.1 hypothetical protein ACJ4_26540 [Pantoea sp. QMID4]GME58248.1 hypothetical protein ACJ2_25090 [Pantoea sp. QMID2]
MALPDYRAQRARFLAAAQNKGLEITSYPHPLSGPQGETLFTDVARAGSASASRLMLVVSGTHGVEGYYGSDCQIAWLDALDEKALPADTALLLVHLLNPWGAAHLRRVNEDNIDLNRNFIDFSQPIPANPDYAQWHGIYHGDRVGADRQLAEALESQGWQAVKRVVEAGQYTLADGFFFGGHQPCWSYLTMKTIINQHLSVAKTILSFDLHTGAGAWGHPMLLSIAEQRYAAHEWGKTIYGQWLTVLLTGTGRDSVTGVTATATGYLSQYLLSSLPDTLILPLVVECGTYEGEDMHRRVREDHWLHLCGDPASAHGQMQKQQLVEGFWPDDADWRALVTFRTQQIFQRGWRALTDTP